MKKLLLLIALLLNNHSWSAQTSTATASSDVKQKESAATVPANIPVDCFETFKQIVTIYPPQHPFITDHPTESTNCMDSAHHVITLLADHTADEPLEFFRKELTDYNPDQEIETKNGFREGVLLPDDVLMPFSEQQLFKHLLTKPLQPQHKLFYITVRLAPYTENNKALKHTFVIEKFYDGKDFWLRLYHSWQDRFSLRSWIGLMPWDAHNNNYGFSKLRNGNKIKIDSATDITGLILFFFNLCNGNLLFYHFTTFNVDHMALEKKLKTSTSTATATTVSTAHTAASTVSTNTAK